MTKREAKNEIRRWYAKTVGKPIINISHLSRQGYVVGHAASGCLIVARCWTESEPQMKEWTRKYPLDIIRLFDESLKAGDWCITAYVRREGCGELIAIPIPFKQPPRSKSSGRNK